MHSSTHLQADIPPRGCGGHAQTPQPQEAELSLRPWDPGAALSSKASGCCEATGAQSKREMREIRVRCCDSSPRCDLHKNRRVESNQRFAKGMLLCVSVS